LRFNWRFPDYEKIILRYRRVAAGKRFTQKRPYTDDEVIKLFKGAPSPILFDAMMMSAV
jgi:hypothetical protein